MLSFPDDPKNWRESAPAPPSIVSSPRSPAMKSGNPLPVIVSPPGPPKMPTDPTMFTKSVGAAPLRSLVFAPGPPLTKSPWIAEHAAPPDPGSAPLTLTLPPSHVTAIASAASLVTCRIPFVTAEVYDRGRGRGNDQW